MAIVGISEDDTKASSRPLKFLLEAGYQGRIYPVHPRIESVKGLRCWPDLMSLPEVPDQAFVLTGSDSAIRTVKQCAELGVGIVTVLAGGFAESGEEGQRRQQLLREIARNSRVRIVGPSSIGLINLRNGFHLTANAAFSAVRRVSRGAFVASQSGSMLGAFITRDAGGHVAFAGMASVGGEVDLSVGEVCSATLEDPEVDSYLLFLEALRHSSSLSDFLVSAAQRGKPVVAYKVGRSARAAEMAATHTGGLCGEDAVADVFLKAHGVARVRSPSSLLEAMQFIKQVPIPTRARPPRVGIMTTTGGGAAMVVDELELRGAQVVRPTPELVSRLRAVAPALGDGLVVDLTLAGVQYEVMKACAELMRSAGEFDVVVAVVGSSARFQPNLSVAPLIACGGTVPFAIVLIPLAPEALEMARSARVACFVQPETCADVICAAFERQVPLPHGRKIAHTDQQAAGFLDEAAGYVVLDELGIPHAPFTTFPVSQQSLKVPFDFPVALKICSSAIQHKSDVGGIKLNIANEDELHAAASDLRAVSSRLASGGTACDRLLAQSMRKGLVEVLLGYRVDEEVGPIVLLAAGGLWAEIAADRSVRLAPVDRQTALEMIGEVRMLRILTGARNQELGDTEALADAIVAFSRIATRNLGVLEAEINPLLVLPRGEGVCAVDVVVKRATEFPA